MGSGQADDVEDKAQRDDVAEVMARIVAGDREAVWDLHTLAER